MKVRELVALFDTYNIRATVIWIPRRDNYGSDKMSRQEKIEARDIEDYTLADHVFRRLSSWQKNKNVKSTVLFSPRRNKNVNIRIGFDAHRWLGLRISYSNAIRKIEWKRSEWTHYSIRYMTSVIPLFPLQ